MTSLIFYSFSAAITLIVSLFAFLKAPKNHKIKTLRFPGIILLFQVAVGWLGSIGVYESFDLPPMLVVFGILPAFIILAFISFSKTVKALLPTVPIHYPILFQSFRIIVELLILLSFTQGLGPIEITFQGYNYEFYFGITALIIGLVAWKKSIPNKILIAWNVFGLIMLAIIVGLFFTCGFMHEAVWGSKEPMIKAGLLHMPYLSIATFYMPIAVWMHIFSIRQLRAKKTPAVK